MEKINFDKMSEISGSGFLDGFCAGAAVVFLFTANPAAGIVTAGCVLYEVTTECIKGQFDFFFAPYCALWCIPNLKSA